MTLRSLFTALYRNLPMSGDQRDRARRTTAECPRGSIGHGININLNSWLVRASGNFAAGNIDMFYQLHSDFLQREATEENVREFANMETRFFQNQPVSVRTVANIYNENQRTNLIMQALQNPQGYTSLRQILELFRRE